MPYYYVLYAAVTYLVFVFLLPIFETVVLVVSSTGILLWETPIEE